MTIKNRKTIYQCAVDGYLGEVTIAGKNGKPKVIGAICGAIRMDGTCGAHGNFKCKHKKDKPNASI